MFCNRQKLFTTGSERSLLNVVRTVLSLLFLVFQHIYGAESSPAMLITDLNPPTVRFDGLRQYSRTFKQVPISIIAQDNVGVSRIEVYIDGMLFATNSVPNLSSVKVNVDWNSIPVGKHTVQARAYDAAGNVQSKTIVLLSGSIELPVGNVVRVYPSIKFQTMQGWEATAQAGELYSPAWNNYRTGLLDQTVYDLGINRLRVEVLSGIENPVDYFAQWRAGLITESQYNAKRYEIINDDSNPNFVNPSGFKWSSFDSTINALVLPMKQRLSSRGESLWVSVNYVDFGPSSFEHKTNPTEYAEFVLATYQHMQSSFGFVPDSWEVILEPDTSGAAWSATQVAEVIKAAGERLIAAGFSPNFVVPSVTNSSNASTYIDQIASTPGAMLYVGEFSYHRYAGATESTLSDIVNRTVLHDKKVGMLEWIGADYNTLHQDIKLGRNSTWQQFTITFPNEPDNGAQYFLVDDTNQTTPTVTIGSRTKFLSQYFRHVRMGSQRIEALSGSATADPLAFINTNGKYVVVVKTSSNFAFDVQGLPAGTYGIRYTTLNQFNVNLADINLSAGQVLPTNIPSAGVITIYAK